MDVEAKPETLALPTLNLESLERLAIDQADRECKGNKTHAAMLLGISRRTLQRREAARHRDTLQAPGATS